MKQKGDLKEAILRILKKKKSLSAPRLALQLGVSRQHCVRLISQLVNLGKVVKTGSTRAALYSIQQTPPKQKIILIKKIKNLQEDLVFDEVAMRMNLIKKTSPNVFTILNYAFTEMLNNAIDHSLSNQVKIEFELTHSQVIFKIIDYGIGIFANVVKKIKLGDEHEAAEHILKGKQTTFPERHSGQGIFFTSKVADQFIIDSHKAKLVIDNQEKDVGLGERRNITGTHVTFIILKKSKRVLKAVFDQFANDDFDFDRTHVIVNLKSTNGLVSRSQAKRLLLGLEKYSLINLDFSKVKEIGQAFIDEVFRVFQNQHTQIQINVLNANPAVLFMIKRGKQTSN